ncbi:MAG TPA: C1 family peptidase [Spirochaetota bacterium]|nr:C1 family peptidase [Spirochaetota bacterium]
MKSYGKYFFAGFFFVLVVLNIFAEDQKKRKFATGANATPEKIYNSVKEVKYKTVSSSDLPKRVDHSAFLPKPGMQGQQGSCVAWSSAYAYKSFHEKIERDWDLTNSNHLFSPAYIYNQLNGGEDCGLYIGDALNLMVKEGVCTLSSMEYDERDYLTQPGNKAKLEASKYKAASYARVNFKNREEVKKILSGGNCIVFGMNIYGNFYDYKTDVYSEVSGTYMGGHAMLLIGYDEDKQAYKLINSWSENWGVKGYAWLDYKVFEKYTADAWVMYDDYQGNPEKKPESPVNVAASQGAYSDRVRISWDTVNGAISYVVYRGEKENSDYYEIGRTNENSFFDMNVKPNKNYFYSVVASSDSGDSDYSAIGIGFTKSKNAKIGIPQNIQGESKENIIYLRWDKVENATGYFVYRYSKKSEDYLKIAESKIAKFKDSKVKVNSKYWYVISAFNDEGESSKSETIQVRVEEEQKKAEKPRSPNNLSVINSDSDNLLKINWDKVADAQNYYLIRWYKPLKDWEVIGYVNGSSYLDKEVKEGVLYYYTLCSVNEYGYSDYAKYQTGFVGKNTFKTSAPKTASASQGKFIDRIEIRWGEASEAENYRIKKTYSKKNDKDFKSKIIDVGPFKNNNWTDFDVTDGYIYSYEIISYDRLGNYSKEGIKATGWTEGTDNNKVNNSYYKYAFDSFESRKSKWDYTKFDDKFFKYIDSQFKELDSEIKEFERETKKKR